MTSTVVVKHGRKYKYLPGGRKVEIDATKAVVQSVKQYQRQDEDFGKLFIALYQYCDQLSFVHFNEQLPSIILSFSSNDVIGPTDKRKGSFLSQDGLCLPYRINLNLSELQTGIDAAEVLTHEAVHAWQFSNGIWNSNNYHDEQWHSKMSEIGILTDTRFGDTIGYKDSWHEWLEEVSSLNLGGFILPGTPQEEQQQLQFTKKKE